MEYYNPRCDVAFLHWHIGEVEVIGEPGAESCGLSLPITEKRIFAHELPTEFFNHQLMKCDASDFGSLRDFVAAWGIPYSPYRYSPIGTRLMINGKNRRSAENALRLTETLVKGMTPVISLAEARHSIETLQGIVQQMRRAIRGESPDDDFMAAINAAACNELVAGTVQGSKFVTVRKSPLKDYWEDERLTSAICNQILTTMADEKPWKDCACDGCEVIFKHRQPKDGVNLKPNADALYCCEPCKNTQSSRNKRHPHIDHGL